MTLSEAQKNILGLVQSAPCRVDIEFKDAANKPYTITTVVKLKGDETETLPLYTSKDSVIGEVAHGWTEWSVSQNA